MRRLVVALISGGVAPLVPASDSATSSGLRGLVTLSPAGPVCLEERRAASPPPSSSSSSGATAVLVARVTTRADGTYRVLLRPGRYTVVAPRYRFGSGITPQTVRVPRGRVAHLDFEIDTGIQ